MIKATKVQNIISGSGSDLKSLRCANAIEKIATPSKSAKYYFAGGYMTLQKKTISIVGVETAHRSERCLAQKT